MELGRLCSQLQPLVTRLPAVAGAALAGFGLLRFGRGAGRRLLSTSAPADGFIHYETLDVFTETPCGGNPLAVCFGAEGLSDASLQKIAREFNYSETTFVLPPSDPTTHTARVRIFTPTEELPFAGHPNVGTACALGWRSAIFGKKITDKVLFEEAGGLVPVTQLSDGLWQLEAPLPFRLSAHGEGLAVEDAAACLGLAPSDIRAEGRLASLGGAPPYALVELSGAQALAQCEPRAAELARHGKVLAWTAADGGADGPDLRARMFNARGIEDPATGAAAGCLVAALVSAEGASAPASTSRRIAQGVEMGRPSLIVAECDQQDGWPTAVRVGGRCVPMMRGRLPKEYFA